MHLIEARPHLPHPQTCYRLCRFSEQIRLCILLLFAVFCRPAFSRLRMWVYRWCDLPPQSPRRRRACSRTRRFPRHERRCKTDVPIAEAANVGTVESPAFSHDCDNGKEESCMYPIRRHRSMKLGSSATCRTSCLLWYSFNP